MPQVYTTVENRRLHAHPASTTMTWRVIDDADPTLARQQAQLGRSDARPVLQHMPTRRAASASLGLTDPYCCASGAMLIPRAIQASPRRCYARITARMLP